MSDIKEITQELEKFRDERDWEQFHNPKDLAYKSSNWRKQDNGDAR